MNIFPIIDEIETAELWELGNIQQLISSRLATLVRRSRVETKADLEYLLTVSTRFVHLIDVQASADREHSAG